MKKLQLVIATALLLGLSSAAFAGSPKDAKKDAKTDANTSTKVEVKAIPSNSSEKAKATNGDLLYYWFDANTSEYIGYSELSGCDNSTIKPCADGYLNVADPNDPQDPGTTPDKTATGMR